MVELAAIELVGKLIRAPYWQCLGHADQHPDAQREMDDWFLSMDDDERVVFIKERLRERRWFDGALDGTRTPAFEAALAGYRRAMGVATRGEIDGAFFKRFLTQNVPTGPLAPPARKAVAPQAASATVAIAATTAAAAAAIAEAAPDAARPTPAADALEAALEVELDVALRRTASGRLDLQVRSDAAGYVYCYAQDTASGSIRRIFPNRFVKDPRIEAGQTVSVPGKARFRLDGRQRFACLQAPREVYNDLPSTLRWGDFDEVRLAGFEQIRQAFQSSSGQPIALSLATADVSSSRLGALK
jgi:hypothetical protein